MTLEEETLPKKKTMTALIVFAVWLVTSASGFMLITTALDTTIRIYAAFVASYGFYGQEYWGAVFIRQLITFAFAGLWLVAVIGGGEYAYQNYNQPGVWKVFSRIIAVQVSVAVLAVVI